MGPVGLYEMSGEDKMVWVSVPHHFDNPCHVKNLSKALIGDPCLQSVCCITFDQAVLKIEFFYLDETIQKGFWFSLGALHHALQPCSQVNG